MNSGDHFNLSGKTALITGGSKELGKYFAMDLARAGAKVVIVNRHLMKAAFITGQTLFVDGGSGAGWVVQWDEADA